VIVEVRAGVCRKNAQIGHIYGVKPGAPRLRADTPDEERDAFANLLLLCLRASRDVDKKTGEAAYPAELMRQLKTAHEGRNGPALAVLGRVDDDDIASLLTEAFRQPYQCVKSSIGLPVTTERTNSSRWLHVIA